MTADIHVIKLGGSLLDFPQLPERFEHWRSRDAGTQAVLVIGGGDAADVVRAFDKLHQLGPELGHRLAVHAMSFNAHLLMTQLNRASWARDAQECAACWARGELAVVEPLGWLEREEARGIRIPRRWEFTSDSIAAHIARELGAGRLTLLKSTLPRTQCGVNCAASLGIVDACFEEASADVPAVDLVNLRDETLPRCVLR